jgi:hypothetical protein
MTSRTVRSAASCSLAAGRKPQPSGGPPCVMDLSHRGGSLGGGWACATGPSLLLRRTPAPRRPEAARGRRSRRSRAAETAAGAANAVPAHPTSAAGAAESAGHRSSSGGAWQLRNFGSTEDPKGPPSTKRVPPPRGALFAFASVIHSAHAEAAKRKAAGRVSPSGAESFSSVLEGPRATGARGRSA